MRIFLIRHGQSQGNVDPSAYIRFGDPQVPLTEEGWRQAQAAGAYLRRFLAERNLAEPQRIWVSSFLRTRQTLSGVIAGMEHAGEPVGGEICEDLRLAEQSFGYLPYVESETGWFRREVGKALAAFSRAVHKGNPYLAVPPMGEAPITGYERVDSFLGTLHRDRDKEGIDSVMIVSHGATIKNFMMRWFHLPMEGWKALRTPGNTDIFMIDNDDGSWKITRIYDGEKTCAAGDNSVAGINRLDRSSLPALPGFLRRNPP